MADEAAKRIILARRRRFVAAALAGVGAAGCGRNCADPEPCLSVTHEVQDAAGARDAEGASDASSARADSAAQDGGAVESGRGDAAADAARGRLLDGGSVAPEQPELPVERRPIEPPRPCLTPKLRR